MKVFVLYHLESDHARAVDVFAHDFTTQTEKQIELIDMDSIEGDQKARVYGVTRLPAVVAVKDDGQLLQMWEGDQLPLIQEVSAFSD